MALTDLPDIRVNQVAISADDIAQEMQYHPAASRRQAAVAAARSLIVSELLRQRALATGLLETDRKLTVAEEDPLFDKLIEKDVQVPQATDEECRRYFDQNREKFTTPPLFEVSHILIAAPADDHQARDQARQQADALLQQLRQAPADFAALARDYSACPSKEVGGSLGQIGPGQTVAEFEQALMRAEEGLLDYPVESRYGYHLIWLQRKIPGKPLDYSMVADKIRQYLNERVRHKAISQYIQHLIDEADIEGFSFDTNDSPLMQ